LKLVARGEQLPEARRVAAAALATKSVEFCARRAHGDDKNVTPVVELRDAQKNSCVKRKHGP
jgi:hypothetical protein